jgi:hypothetical protein
MKYSKIASQIFIFGIGMGLFHLAQAIEDRSNEAIRAKIQIVLKNRHPNETADFWRNLGPSSQVVPVITSMYQDNNNIYEKIRLMDALAWFNEPSATQFMKEEAENNSNRVIRSSAIRSVGLSQGTKEHDFFRKILKNSDPHIRAVAAEALIRMNDSKSDQIVDDAIKKEKIEWVTAKVKSHLVRREKKHNEKSSISQKLLSR